MLNTEHRPNVVFGSFLSENRGDGKLLRKYSHPRFTANDDKMCGCAPEIKHTHLTSTPVAGARAVNHARDFSPTNQRQRYVYAHLKHTPIYFNLGGVFPFHSALLQICE